MAEALSTDVTVVENNTSHDETWDENDDNYDNEEGEGDDDDDDDADAEAEEIARRLRDQLWADINAARANANAATPTVPAVIPPPNVVQTTRSQPLSKKEEAALVTMRAILTFADKDTLVRATLASAIVPDSNGDNVLGLLTRCAVSGTILKSVAKPLSHLLVSLARSDALFSTLRHSNAPAIQLDKGKRKRDEVDEQDDSRAHKRPFYTHYDMQAQVTDAVRVVTQALSAPGVTSRPLDPALVRSIQLQLHQIFLFAVTSSARGGADMNALQEICGLIQVIGVLSGIQIGPTPDAISQPAQQPPTSSVVSSNSSGAALPSVQTGDIGTAVYPCPTCRKIFSRLYSLRAHLRVHGPDRPYRCTSCPATFARSYDLKRHAKLHDKTAWRCSGCAKMFSRRDAIKRHKNSAMNRGILGEACVNGEVEEVEQNAGGEKLSKDGRQVKMWGDIPANQASGVMEYGLSSEEGPLEEGEVRTDVIARLQSIVTSLHGLLSAHVTNTLGTPSRSDSSPLPGDPTNGQATLASVIARAQLRNLPIRPQEPEASPPIANQDPTSSHNQIPTQDVNQPLPAVSATPLTLYGLSNDQAKMLEQAIANAASAAQAQAEAEAALEEEDEGSYEDDEVDEEAEGGDQDA